MRVLEYATILRHISIIPGKKLRNNNKKTTQSVQKSVDTPHAVWYYNIKNRTTST